MFLYRTGLGGADEYVRNFNHYFWKTYIVDGYGHNADILLKASFLIVAAMIVGYIILRKLVKIREDEQMKTLLSVSATVIFPCFLQVYLLRNHSAIHDFSALKFSIVLSVVTFSLLPAAIVEAIKIAIPKFNRQFLMICTATVFTTVCLVTTRNFFAEKGDSFFPSKLNPEVESMGTFVSENTGYEDLVFSDRYAVVGATEDPPRIAITKKQIHYSGTLAGMFEVAEKVDGNYIVNVFDFNEPSGNEDILKLENLAYEIIADGNYKLYKIKKEDFWALNQ